MRSAAASKQAEIIENILAEKKRKNSEEIESESEPKKLKLNVRNYFYQFSSILRLNIIVSAAQRTHHLALTSRTGVANKVHDSHEKRNSTF